MTLASYAKRSPFSLDDWREANDWLKLEGFEEADRKRILDAAVAQRLNPKKFANQAIRLRQHVAAGLPLS